MDDGFGPPSFSTPCRPDGNAACQRRDAEIGEALRHYMPIETFKRRVGPNGASILYVEGWRVIERANAIFGFDGWSSQVVSLATDYSENMNSRWHVGCSAIVKVTTRQESYHEDVGFGTAEMSNKGLALEKAKKEAVTDATKRALRLFGNALGNAIRRMPEAVRSTSPPYERAGAPSFQMRPRMGGVPLQGSTNSAVNGAHQQTRVGFDEPASEDPLDQRSSMLIDEEELARLVDRIEATTQGNTA